MGWLAEHASAARRPAGPVAGGAHRRRARRQLRPEDDPLAGADDPERGVISVYARGRDYHDTIKKRLKALARWIVARWPGELDYPAD